MKQFKDTNKEYKTIYNKEHINPTKTNFKQIKKKFFFFPEEYYTSF